MKPAERIAELREELKELEGQIDSEMNMDILNELVDAYKDAEKEYRSLLEKAHNTKANIVKKYEHRDVFVVTSDLVERKDYAV